MGKNISDVSNMLILGAGGGGAGGGGAGGGGAGGGGWGAIPSSDVLLQGDSFPSSNDTQIHKKKRKKKKAISSNLIIWLAKMASGVSVAGIGTIN